ncbi:MAG: pyridoxal phosphate-dependent aminotransferase [Lentimicrobium sp.]|jgi:aspartate aminotransferase|nr:pyridoxal phosphate-dependent aminotransferase [Lentimicrobium sp.]MDD2526437.1 pyridoxal phosphate-dependent aminotransferase [Lentimicrobiaceae bacterium]MDY0026377.1 pyridoxal phosphate-dependent aminotransferase [Lentimicrobium sp.]
MITLSERIGRLAESETLAMTRRSRELNEQGHHVINLSIGQPDFFTPDYIKAAAKKAIDENFTFYSPVSGYPELRKSICHKLKRDNNLDYTPDQIVVSTGAKQSLTNIILSVVNPGDEVLVPAPYWVSYREIIKLAEGTMININAGVETDFKITPQQLQQAITSKTKAFIFSSPCNPTGSVYTRDELHALAQVFSQYPQISIVSDEIYELINFEGRHHSIASFPEIKEQVIVVNGVSKGFAMTGWRLGYCAATREIAAACDKIQGQVTSGTCSISQQAAIAAVMSDPAHSAEVKSMVDTFKTRRDLMLSLMADIPGLRTNIPQGAFYIFPDVTEYYGKTTGDLIINNGTDLCNYLLDYAHIALVSGEAFGNPDCIRISYATSNEALIEAGQRMKKALGELK